MPHRIAFLGPPGAGKGTQAQLLAPVLGVPIIGPGALYRAAIAQRSPLGVKVAAAVEHGAMVPNEVTNAIMAARIAEPDCAGGFILDGYPREIAQLHALDAAPSALTHAVLLEIPEDEVYRRLADRLVCICGQKFNRRELAIDAGDEARCDACDGTLERRKDDDPERIARRVEHYRAETEPVIATYRARGIVVAIDGARPVHNVHADICARLGIQKPYGGKK